MCVFLVSEAVVCVCVFFLFGVSCVVVVGAFPKTQRARWRRNSNQVRERANLESERGSAKREKKDFFTKRGKRGGKSEQRKGRGRKKGEVKGKKKREKRKKRKGPKSERGQPCVSSLAGQGAAKEDSESEPHVIGSLSWRLRDGHPAGLR